MSETQQPIYRFNGFSLDTRAGLLRNGSSEIALRPKSLDLLGYLIRNAGRVVSKDELLRIVWSDVIVTEDSLTQCISDIRRALGDKEQKLIRTVARRGYRFAEDTLETGSNAAPEPTGGAGPSGEAAKPSIAVLPFSNVDGDPEQQEFADGLTEDLITELSRTGGLIVIARHSSFAFKGRMMDARQIARELGVSYLVEGRVRRAAGRVRINVQLVNAAKGDQIWAERFDRALEDVFAIQDEVTAKITEALLGRLTRPPVRNRPRSMVAQNLCVRGRNLTGGQSPEAAREASVLLRQAIALDPSYAEAHCWLALNLWTTWNHFFEPQQTTRSEALAIAQRAVELDPNDSSCRWVLGHLLNHERRFEEGDAEIAKAVELDPNDADAWMIMAEHSIFRGRSDLAVDQAMKAFRLNPFPASWYYWELGLAQYCLHQYEAAAATLRHKATHRTVSRRILAASLAQLGQLDEARLEAQLFMANNPRFTVARWVPTQPVRDEAVVDHLVDGYLKAGLPE